MAHSRTSLFLGSLLVLFMVVQGLGQEKGSGQEKGPGQDKGPPPGQEGGRRGQGGFGGFGGAIDRPTLLGSDQVRHELKVNPEQAKKLDEVIAAYRKESMELYASMRSPDLSQEEREKMGKEILAKRAELTKKTGEKLDILLEKPQTQRLNEIVLQVQGTDALASEPVAAALKLSKEQIEKIKAATAARDEEMRSLRGGLRGAGGPGGFGGGGPGGGGPGGAGGFQEMIERSEKVRKKADEAALAVLTKDQRDDLEKLKGKPFEIDRRSLFSGRGGPGGGPGGGFGGGQGGGFGGGPGGGRGKGEKVRPAQDDQP
jgi:hypothetical protein